MGDHFHLLAHSGVGAWGHAAYAAHVGFKLEDGGDLLGFER